jgi:hypothetical protein
VIIDCDTHLVPRDAFDRIDGRYREIKPTLKFDPGGRMKKFEDVRLLRDNPKISEEAKERSGGKMPGSCLTWQSDHRGYS